MAIKVRKLDKNGDWTFGNGQANYIDKNNAIGQNVKTRLQSFKYDWFLDTDANIDWFNILGYKNNEQTIKDNILFTTLNTDGVTEVDDIIVTKSEDRELQLSVKFITIYNTELIVDANIPL